MRWKWWQFRSRDRRLEFTLSGRWFLGATIALGVAAIYSGNNVIYLLESLLLSTLLFSGVLSELTLKNVRVERATKQAVAGAAAGDMVHVINKGRFPLFCVEVGEWREDGEEELLFVLSVPAGARVTLKSRQVLPVRGVHRWSGLTLATSFPFGFARKTRFLSAPGNRLVWPSPLGAEEQSARGEDRGRGDHDITLGELEEAPAGADLARVHWPSFARTGKLLRRPLRPNGEAAEVRLQLYPSIPALEQRIREASHALKAPGAVLVLVEERAPRRLYGQTAGNDALARLPKEGA